MKRYITTLLTLLVLFPSVHATTVEDSIIGLYVAYYNRAPDINGFNFWKKQANQNDNAATLKTISIGFEASPQFSTDYPITLSNKEFITKIYQNILNRNPDQGGLNHWVNRLEQGLSKSDFIIEYVNAVLNYEGSDEEGKKSATMLKNKLIVSLFFMDILLDASNGDFGSEAYQRSIDVLENITEESETVTSAENIIKEYCRDTTIQCTKDFNLTLKDSGDSNKKCIYEKIHWKADGTLELILKDFNSCF